MIKNKIENISKNILNKSAPMFGLVIFILIFLFGISATLTGFIAYNIKSYFMGIIFMIFGIILLIYSGIKIKKYRSLIILNFRYVCKECDYIWKSKKIVGTPARCPRCASKYIIHGKNLNKI
ncbi:hypothetical protein HYX08_01815 [Candidatus Woesearchaeota archaeon]|nr:hypothetical protein [Candidatus Woesearchaeota archaeon]